MTTYTEWLTVIAIPCQLMTVIDRGSALCNHIENYRNWCSYEKCPLVGE